MAQKPTRAMRRYNKTVILLSLLYAVLLMGAVYAFNRHLISGPLAYVAAILPALPIVGIFGAIGRYFVEEQDEYIRMMMVRQSLIASGIALSLATVWGFLESFDLVRHIDAYYIAVVWFAGLGAGGCYNALTNRADRA
ncbi:hypothetical protein ASG11_03945 [Sphingomonas sp. Leaf357]|uniref:hypothetical protein n=1 Tax=Sphingomonas sp. Leaf357 TaxID=1736350 RepID=UPI000701BA21|nr:hypothetical protein [Sphingomonas sp. Leaf357]KQS03514.1 hypothetical protein ASG11_03945 [Sphingomonas sp. Leaf357]